MFDKLRNIRGVQHVLVFNAAGILLRTTFNHSEAVPAIGLFSDLIFRARRAIEVFDRCDGLTSMRIKTLKFEILISKDTDDLIFIVFQDAKGRSVDDLYRSVLKLCCKYLHLRCFRRVCPTYVIRLHVVGETM